MNGALFRKEFFSSIKLFCIFSAVLLLYIISIVYMYNPKMSDSLQQFYEMMPEMMAAFGMESIGNTLIEFLSTYLYGFLMLILPLVFMIILSNKLIMGYIEQGSMAYLLTTPNTRLNIVMTQAIFLVSSIFTLITLMSIVTITFSEVSFPGELDIKKFIYLNVGLFCLHFAISGFCFLMSCASSDLRTSYSYCIGIPIGFYLIQSLANLGGKLENLQYFTIFSLFSPEKIIHEDSNMYWMLLVLLIIGIVFYSIAIRIFTKRDLHL